MNKTFEERKRREKEIKLLKREIEHDLKSCYDCSAIMDETLKEEEKRIRRQHANKMLDRLFDLMDQEA